MTHEMGRLVSFRRRPSRSAPEVTEARLKDGDERPTGRLRPQDPLTETHRREALGHRQVDLGGGEPPFRSDQNDSGQDGLAELGQYRVEAAALSLPQAKAEAARRGGLEEVRKRPGWLDRSEEHTSELQSRLHLVCRLLLEKKKRSTENPHPLGTNLTWAAHPRFPPKHPPPVSPTRPRRRNRIGEAAPARQASRVTAARRLD